MINEIVICMGSSCFSRGNVNNLEVIETFLAQRGLTNKVIITGSRCEERCCDGPNIKIGDEVYGKMDRKTLLELLERHLGSGAEG